MEIFFYWPVGTGMPICNSFLIAIASFILFVIFTFVGNISQVPNPKDPLTSKSKRKKSAHDVVAQSRKSIWPEHLPFLINVDHFDLHFKISMNPPFAVPVWSSALRRNVCRTLLQHYASTGTPNLF